MLDGENVLEMTPGKLRAVRWTGASIIFQGAMHALNPVQRIGDQIAEAITVHQQAGEQGGHGARRARCSSRSACRPAASRTIPHELSGGQKQRVMIAMALACSPRWSSPTSRRRRST